MSPRLFRSVLLGSWVLAGIGAVASFALTSTLPDPLREHVDAMFDPSRPMTHQEIGFIAVALPLILVSVWNLVELLRFRRRARPVYVAIIIVCVFVTPFAGPFVEPALAVAAYYSASILAGVGLSVMWWSAPIAARFEAQVVPERWNASGASGS